MADPENSSDEQYECVECGWLWPLPGLAAGAECDNCGGELEAIRG